MPAAGRLDRIVQFRRATIGSDGFGATETWADHGAPQPAQRTDVSDGEKSRAGEVQATLMTRFVLRWSAFTAALTPKDRLVTEGRDYSIHGIKEPPGTRRQWLEITASARNDLS